MNTDWEQVKSEWVEAHPEVNLLLLKYLFDLNIELPELGQIIDPDYETDLHDPMLLPDIAIASNRILAAIKDNQKILVFCDYDADGLPGAAILDTFFKKIQFTNYHIQTPSRNVDGFGLKSQHVEQAIADDIELLITIDCGSASLDALALAAKKSLDVIVTDHHEVPDIPAVDRPLAIVNPMAPGSKYPFTGICGAVVVFKLVQAIIIISKADENGWPAIRSLVDGWDKWLLDLVAVATVGDMMPLRDENRTLVRYGLKVLNQTRNHGLRALIDATRLERGKITETDISFRLAPRINAASRIGREQVALDTLMATDPLIANRLASELEGLNNERKKIVTQMLKQAHKKIGPASDFDPNVLSVGDAGWLPGMCGLLASRLVEEYGVSAFVWGRGPSSVIKGSCRASGSDNVYKIMSALPENLVASFGGHVGAGGFVLNQDQVHSLQDELEAAKSLQSQDNPNDKKFDTRVIIDTAQDDLNAELLKTIETLAPYGKDFPRPSFRLQSKVKFQQFGKNNEHLKLIISQNLSGIMWRTVVADLDLDGQVDTELNIIGELEYDSYAKSPRLQVSEITRQQPGGAIEYVNE